MCIAIYKPKNIKIKEKVLNNCFLHHYDGIGFSVFNDETNELIVRRGFFTMESFYKAFRPYEKMKAVIHFRWATHGDINEENCHPFAVNDDLVFFHNGKVENVKIWNENLSDTWHFNEAILKPIINKFPNMIKNPIFKILIEKFIKKNKLVFMNSNGEVYIFNEEEGIWDCGCWFSNGSYEKKLDNKRERKKEVSKAQSNITTKTNITVNSNKKTDAWFKAKGINEELAEFYSLSNPDEEQTYELVLESLFQQCEQEEINNIETIAAKRELLEIT